MSRLISAASGVIVFVVCIIFAVTASEGDPWYWYIINTALLFAIASFFNTLLIQLVSTLVAKARLQLGGSLRFYVVIGLVGLVAYWALSYILGSLNSVRLFLLINGVIALIVMQADGQVEVALRKQLSLLEAQERIKEKRANDSVA